MRLAIRILLWVVAGMIAMSALALPAMSWLLEPTIHASRVELIKGVGPTIDRLLQHEPHLLDTPENLEKLIGLHIQVVEPSSLSAELRQELDTSRVASDSELTSLFALANDRRILRVGPVPEPRFSVATQLIVALSLSLVVSILITFVLVRPILARLASLRWAADRISEGDLDARADQGTDDALGAVARAFNRMGQRVQAVVRGQRELLQAVSHELRTPVARIRFDLELARGSEPDTRHRKLAAIEESAIELESLIAELTEYIRFQSGIPQLHRRPIDISAEITRGIQKHQHVDPDKAMIADIPEGLEIHASLRHFRRVVDNLVSNAARHATSQVHVAACREEDSVVLSVEDDGPGISADDYERVFEPFIRLDESRAREHGGTGLGLALVARILAWHGGAISLSKGRLGGARFECTWPARSEPVT